MKNFKDFILRGNVVDLAVAVLIGAAFNSVVDSMTKDIITPIIGLVGGQPDFSAFKIGPVAVGNFINAVVSFLIKAIVVYYAIVKPFNALIKILNPLIDNKPTLPPDVIVLTEIRDILKNQHVK